ncbi:MAG: HAMP domain-containing histidine kinase [Firmicutes bacterium]|nr:HAMP domain-containing histidine kinase [Bacillota bacterium]
MGEVKIRSVFGKLLLIELGVTIGVVLIMNLLLLWFFRGYVFRRHEKLLWDVVAQAQEVTTRMVRQEVSEKNWQRALRIIDRSSGVHLAVFRGNSLLVSTERGIAGISSDPGFLKQVLARAGRQKAAILGVPGSPDLELLVVSSPLSVLSRQTTLVAYTAASNVKALLGETLSLIWLASLLVLALATPVVYFAARHFTHPLEEVQQIARKFAQGDFSQRLEMERRDEIGVLAEVLNEMAWRLELIEKNRQEFLANVSHELRTPLTSISGFIQGIIDGTIPEKDQKYYLSQVYRETQRLARITNDLLDMARMQAGEMEYHWETLDLWEVCREASESLLPLAQEKKVVLLLNLPEKPAIVQGDRARLIQVLVNLLDNALKFTPGGGRVEVEGKVEENSGMVAVADQGPGIPPGEIPFIFERFYRGNATGGGTGLGLAISKLIVEAHRGDIAVFSQAGGGTTFCLSLPLSSQRLASSAAQPPKS